MRNLVVKPYRIVTEGAADAAFFNALIKCRNIPDMYAGCAVKTPEKDKEGDEGAQQKCGGKSAIPDEIIALYSYAQLKPGFLRGIIIAVDCDKSCSATLKEVQDYIRGTKLKLPAPVNFREKRRHEETNLSLAIICLPGPEKLGCLDTLLYESFQTSHPDLVAPIDAFEVATMARTQTWGINPKSKMRLRCGLSVIHEDDPSKSLTYLLTGTTNPFDLNSPIFDDLANFLAGFAGQNAV